MDRHGGKSRPKSQAAKNVMSRSLQLSIVHQPGTAPRHARGPLIFPSNVAWPHARPPSVKPAGRDEKGVPVAGGRGARWFRPAIGRPSW